MPCLLSTLSLFSLQSAARSRSKKAVRPPAGTKAPRRQPAETALSRRAAAAAAAADEEEESEGGGDDSGSVELRGPAERLAGSKRLGSRRR